MTEPPRPPGDDDAAATPPEPTSPPPSPPPYSSGEATPPPPPQDVPPPQGDYPPAGGYPPPSGGYPPTGGYAATPGMPPPGYANAEEKTWALIAHFGGAAGMFLGGGVLGWVAPLVALLAKGNQSPTVRAHSVAALNFQLLWSIIGLIGYATICIVIGFVPLVLAYIVGIVFGIIAGVKANDGQLYRYPMTVNMIR